MKVCNRCGGDNEGAKDGENLCLPCRKSPVRKTRTTKKLIERELRMMGLTKVKGALGGTYWE